MERAGPPTQERGASGRRPYPLALNEARTKAASKERQQVVSDITCEEGPNQETIPDAAHICSVLGNELAAAPNLQINTLEAIYTPERSNHWHWSIIFDSTDSKQLYDNREEDFIRMVGGKSGPREHHPPPLSFDNGPIRKQKHYFNHK